MTSPAPSSFQLIFVHGTWAKDRPFGHKNTFFVQKLMEFFDEATLHRRFPWSGRNTVGARERAAREFTEFVAELPPKSPNTKRFAICHSHGGSVVLTAFLDEATAASFDGLICIGTPFLHVYRLTEVEPTILPPLSLGYASLAWIALGLSWWFGIEVLNALFNAMVEIISVARHIIDLGAIYFIGWVVRHPFLAVISAVASVVAVWLAVVAALVGLAILGLLIGVVDAFLLDPKGWPIEDTDLAPSHGAAWSLKQRCRLPHSVPMPTLLLRVPADEAYGALIFSRVVSFLIVRLYGLVVLTMTVAIAQSRTLPYLGPPIGLLIGSVRFLIRCILSFPVALFAGAALLPFGREFFRVGGQILISAESTPPGTWQLTVLPPLDFLDLRLANKEKLEYSDGFYVTYDSPDVYQALLKEWEATTQGIIHSRGYTDPRAVSLITKWMSGLS